MSTTTRALIAIPATILLTLGLSACQDQAVSTPPSQDSQAEAQTTGSSEATTGDDSTDDGAAARERTASPTRSPSAPETSSVSSTKVAVGNCLKDLGSAANGEAVGDVTVVDCSEPHLYEVYAESEMTGTALPSEQEIETTAAQTCGAGFESFVGISAEASQTYTYTYFYPTQASWDHGDRLISCMVVTQDETETTGSAKGAAQ
ncbi:septum formation family protein [Actinomyces bowdenii]|uniref:Septum formation-related domain-containing protein n=1 Tax=Actinomyces bowdenii TaxID=131109 RepID=A0A3P1V4J6_9ACTO|nr:septum formation family protein [Actinomyces bowdenii]MBO3723617.1 septum formation family protein [Actinomyces bowdenii]RRD29041.1 hypothetical protein EII10_08090 [Actinomyces bowdenii]